ncbi:MAG: McrC family protein [Phycisphaerales bacterium JB054]
MRLIHLTEYQRTPLHGLGRAEVDLLRETASGMRLEPSLEAGVAFDAIPGSWVGVVLLPSVEVQIHPKIPIDRLMFLLSYAADPDAWSDDAVGLAESDSPLDAVAAAFLRLLSRATRRGLLHGYRTVEETLHTVRGRIQFTELVQRRHGIPLPVPVEYDEYTPDIVENQILKAALGRLRQVPLRSAKVRRGLREVASAFAEVSDLGLRRIDIPEIQFNRLNKHYEPAVMLAGLILRGSSFELGAGPATGSAFLLNMNDVFEAFVHRALCEALAVQPTEFRRGVRGVHLDEDRRVHMEPDLSWWRGSRCTFVGDAKYKRLEPSGIKHADLYQLLAYTTALDLDRGLLIYAASEASPASHAVRFCGKQLEVAALDLNSPPADILHAVTLLADRIRELAEYLLTPSPPASVC